MKFAIVLQSNGRIVIPVEIRQQLKLESGQRLELMVQEGRIILTPQINRLRQAQALLSEHVSGDDSCCSDELITERRNEAKHD